MIVESVLYDAPGPRARRRALIGTVVAAVATLCLLSVVAARMVDQGQFSMELWGPLINPGNATFGLVWTLILKGLVATVVAAALAVTFSVVLGTALGAARMLLGSAARIPLVGWIELFRGLPVVVTMYFVYTLIRATGIDIGPLPGEDGLWFVVIGLTLYNSVIIAEIVRAGVASLPRGQRESAFAIGMSRRQSMLMVELPQAVRTMLPALITQLVVVLKDTSLGAILGLYIELLRRGNLIAQNLDNPIQVLFVVGLIFVVMNYGLTRLAIWVERRLSSSRGGESAMRAAEEVVPQT